jgi:Flp pilus assembly protein TadD
MRRVLSICAIAAIAAFRAFGAGSAPVESSEKPAVKQEKPAAKQEKQTAKQEKQTAKQESPAVSAYNQGVELMKSKRFAQAQSKFEQAVKLDPNFAEAYMYRGVLYTQMGRKADAQADLVLLKKLDGRLAKELEEFMQTGKEEDYLYGATKKK